MSIEELLTHRRAAGVLVRTKPGVTDNELTSLEGLFDTEAGTRGNMLSAGRARRARRGPGTGASPMLVFPKLGVVYGAVTKTGLESLRAHAAVDRISAANGLRMIRPVPYSPGPLAASATKPAETGPTWGIQALGADALWAQGLSGQGVLVGHLDTGIDGEHPMLIDAIERAAVFDHFGQLRPGGKTPTDSGDHGTHTAGTIAGRRFKKVQAGVAPGAKLLSAEVIEGGDSIARVLGGLNWVVEQGARVVSLSLGWPGWVDSFLLIMDALRENGCLPVVAAGNEGEGATRSPGNYQQVLSIGAVGPNGRVAPFSGSEIMQRPIDAIVPDIVAPGVDIWSAAPGGGWQMLQGTSMATPHIAGLSALLLEAHPAARIDQVEAAILASARRKSGMPEARAGRGMPDAVQALQHLNQAMAP